MNAFNVCVAIIVILTLAGFVVGLVRAKSDGERIPVVAAFTAQVVVVAAFLVLVAGMRRGGAVPVALAVACAVLPIAVYLIVQRACGPAKLDADAAGASAAGRMLEKGAAHDGRSKDDVWSNLRGPGQGEVPGQAVQPVQTGSSAPAVSRTAQPGQTARIGQPAQPKQPGQQEEQPKQPLRSASTGQPAHAGQSAARPVREAQQAAQPVRVPQATQPIKSVQAVQSQSGAASSAQPAQSATPQTGGEVTQRFAPVTTASGAAEKPVQQDGATTPQPGRQNEPAASQPAREPSRESAPADSAEPSGSAEPGIDEKEAARQRAAQEATRRASIAYADRKAKAEAFRSKGKYLIAAGLFEKAAETAPNKASRRTVAFEQLSCYVKAGKSDKARELACALRRESTLTRAERVKLNAIIAQG